MYKGLIMKISYCIVALLVAIALVMNVVSVPVYAADVESLPALDEEINIIYDSDSVTINGLYDIPFKQDVRYFDGTNYHYINKWTGDGTYNEWSDGGTPYYASIYTNSTYDRKASPFSYWYSPEQNRVYNFTGHSDCMKVESYANGVFHFKDTKENGHFLQFGYFDLTDMTYIPLGFIGNDSSCVLYLESGDLVSRYTDIDGSRNTFPDDMVCVYSSYEISGFYDPDELSVFTPDYYFDYQYIYYVDGVGYTFIDSARPLDYIASVSGGTNAGLYFDEPCNKHVYTSTDGVNWSNLTTASSMYGIYFSVPYQWFYDSVGGVTVATLIYTNDEGFAEEPLLTPEYGDINDIIGVLYDEDYIKDITSVEIDLGSSDIVMDGSSKAEYVANFFLKLMGKDYSGAFDIVINSEDDYAKQIYDLMVQDSLYDSFTSLSTTRFVFNSDGSVNKVVETSLYAYIKAIYQSLYNVNLRLDNMQTTLHNDIKSVFDNITNTNSYLYDIKGLIQDMPDYSSKLSNLVKVLNNSNGSLNEINEKLDNIANSMSEGGTGSGEASPDAGGGSSSTSDVLDNIDFNLEKLSDYFVTDNGAAALLLVDGDEQTNTNVYDTFQDFLVTIDDEILTVLYGIADDVDDDDIIDDIFDTDDEDNEDYWKEVSSFVKEALAVFTTNSVLTMAYTYAGSVTDGIGWLNARVDTFYNSSDVYKPVITLGAILFLVSVYLRKGGY